MTRVTTEAVLKVWMDSQTFAGPSEMHDAEDAFYVWLNTIAWGGPSA